jgi:predicted kinase
MVDVPGCVRISKDDLRDLMRRGLPWDSKQEHIAIEAEKLLINLAYENNKNIIIDDTNLNPKHTLRYKELAELFEYEFRIIETDISVEKRLHKDISSTKKIGRDNIYNMAYEYGLTSQETEFVVYDLDGTLADNSKRINLAFAGLTFNRSIYDDPRLVAKDDVRISVRDNLFNDFDTGYEIIIISERRENLREVTEKWLAENCIYWNRLILRPDDDPSTEQIFKKNAVLRLTDPRFLLRFVDDSRYVIEELDKIGIRTFEV